jgi:hypothetical protein
MRVALLGSSKLRAITGRARATCRLNLCYNPAMTKLLEQTLSKIRALPDDKQDAIAQVLARELELLEQLGQMAADPTIQRELKAINEEFAMTELDGLAKL